MTKYSIPQEIKRLNADIEKCTEKVHLLFDEEQHCSSYCESCYEKCLAMYHKNYVGISRKKTANATVTKMEIIPKCDKLNETCVTERAVVDVRVKKQPSDFGLRSKRGKSVKNFSPKEMVDAATAPINLTENHLTYDRDRPWGLILKSNRPLCKNKYRRYKMVDFSSTDDDGTGSSSQPVVFTRHTYTKNKGVQCEGLGKVNKENNPKVLIQSLLKRIKRKLKGDACMESLLGELECELKKLLDRQKNSSQFVPEAEGNHGNDKRYQEARTVLTHSNHLPLSGEEVDYVAIDEAHANLEATCRELEDTCQRLKKERDTSIKLAADKSSEFVETLVREAEIKNKLDETNNQIREMSVRLENYAVSMTNLNEHVKILQNENKEIKKLKQQVEHLTGLLRMITEENKNLLSELQVITVERNKLQIALAVKERSQAKKTKLHSSTSEIMEAEGLLQEVNEQFRSIEYPRTKQLVPENKSSSDSVLFVPQSNVNMSSPSLGMAPSLYRGDSVASVKTPSPSSDRLMLTGPMEERNESPIIPTLTGQRSSPVGQQFNLDKLEKLKGEIKNIFSEIRQLADDISSRKVIDLNVEDISTDLNWSNGSHNNSVRDKCSSDLDNS